jgi:hypothetical protein
MGMSLLLAFIERRVGKMTDPARGGLKEGKNRLVQFNWRSF